SSGPLAACRGERARRKRTASARRSAGQGRESWAATYCVVPSSATLTGLKGPQEGAMELILAILAGLVIGLAIGWLLFGRRPAEAGTPATGGQVAADERLRAERNDLVAERDRLSRELQECKAARRALESRAATAAAVPAAQAAG